MPTRFSLALVALIIPLAASADDELPIEQAPPAEEGAPIDVEAAAPAEGPVVSPSQVSTTTTTTTADGRTTTTTTTNAPGAAAPIVAAPSAPVAMEDPCGTYKHARWREKMRGRLSIGLAKSHLHFENDVEAKQSALVVRVNGRRGFSLEGEFSHLRFDGSDDKARTGSIALVKTFGRRKVAPYVLAGAGGGKYEYADGTEQKVRFGEIGGGVMYRGRRFSIGVDVRRGVRKFKDAEVEATAMPTAERMSTPETGDDDDHDHYTRGRVIALFNF